MNNLILETAPQEIQGIQLAFEPRLGAVVHYFPERTAFEDAAIEIARTTKGVIQVDGTIGIGARVTIDAANGSAVYELTGRVSFTVDGQATSNGYSADRRSTRVKTPGTTAEVRTYDTLHGFTDEWPMYAAFGPAFFLQAPHVTKRGALLTVQADGVTADYLLELPHPFVRKGWIGERTRLIASDGIVVTLPSASVKSKMVS